MWFAQHSEFIGSPEYEYVFRMKDIDCFENMKLWKFAKIARLEGGRYRGLKIRDDCHTLYILSDRHENKKNLVKSLADLWWRSKLNLLLGSFSVDLNLETSYREVDQSMCIEIHTFVKRTAI